MPCQQVYKKLGGSVARKANLSMTKGYSTPENVMLSLQTWRQLAGACWLLPRNGLDIGQHVVSNCIGHHLFLLNFIPLSFIPLSHPFSLELLVVVVVFFIFND